MKTILILESNPNGNLDLNQEIRDLKAAIDRAHNQDQFSIAIRMAVRSEDLQPLLLQHQPHIIHFCSQGNGRSLSFSSEAFSLCKSVECVILNACYSNAQASALAQHINFVISMEETILDTAARYFAEGFYLALGSGQPFDIAYQWGCNAIQNHLSESIKPTLWQKQTRPPFKPAHESAENHPKIEKQ